MAKPDLERARNIGRRQTQPGVAGADGRRDNPVPPVNPEDDIVTKGGQIAQDDQKRSGLAGGQS